MTEEGGQQENAVKRRQSLKKRSGWFSSNMAQLMVFANGLILTITAFITLNLFIEELVYDGMQKTALEVNERIERELTGAERTMRMISSTFSLLPPDHHSRFANISAQALDNAHIAQMYVLSRERDSGAYKIAFAATAPRRQGQATPIPELTAISKDNFLGRIAGDRFTREASSVRLYPTAPGNAPDGAELAVLAQPVFFGDYLSDIVVGVIVPADLINVAWLRGQDAVQDVRIQSADGRSALFRYQSDAMLRQDVADLAALYKRNFTLETGGTTLTVDISIMPGARDNFLVKIPLLMLLLGITLTLIGTLYVRNNLRQSQKLSRVNRELARKNQELNRQIGEGVRLTQVIQQQERDNRAVIDSVSDIIFETSTGGDILFLNETWHRVTGFEVEQSLRRNLFDMLYLQDQREQRQNFEAMLAGKKKSYRTYTRLRTNSGTFRSVELAVSMIRQNDKNEWRVVGTITDVEERRRAERALAEAEKKYRAIVENAAGGIYQVTPEGIFLSANPAAAHILGYDSPEAMLRDVRNVTAQLYTDHPARERFLTQVAASDEPLRAESQMVRADGLVIWVSETLRSVRDENDVLLYFEGSWEDVTQRKDAEIAMARAKMESDIANRAKSEFLANMSHELRTPLNSIIGFSEIIKNESHGPLGNKEYWTYANDIFDSGKRLLSVINEILDVSRIQAGERQLNEGIVSIPRIAESCLDMMRVKAEAGGLTIVNHLQDSDIRLIAEAQAVKQMLLNLLSNAVKFTPEGGLVTISGEVDEAGQCRISVTDTGMGLSDEEIKKALSPFGQIDTDHSRKKSGTGLGLTLVDALMTLHGGALELISQKGIGTTATLVFPARRLQGNAAPAAYQRETL